ncbi:FAD/NAD(P)-binding protein [Rhizosaccharibacter radicis]|uniref:FAD/NAD(P)-binding protein n=1 Tax=Rhizosaccharibacter radicis TaxID=2782605 RepID=A0ABT1W0G3_9PROT|nr:FAD/NAD(P)-binding protein [Acetobacteraceae bacterium KSS12]
MPQRQHIAIVGGGASGTLLAWQLARQGLAGMTTLLDPAEAPGAGLAYSTSFPQHLVNVRNETLSADPSDAGHLLRWVHAMHDPGAGPDGFIPRRWFGDYLRTLFRESGVRHRRGVAVAMERRSCGPVLLLADGSRLHATHVVLATGNFPPPPLPELDDAAIASGRYHHDVWDPDALGRIGPDEDVVLIGTGLSTVDAVLRLRAQAHRGALVAVSRRAWLPEVHRALTVPGSPVVGADVQATARGYLAAFRRALRDGIPAAAAVDSLRATSNALWLALSENEKRRFRRHLQRRWDVVRRRMAPMVGAAVTEALRDESLTLRRGRVTAVRQDGDALAITVRTPGGTDTIRAGHAINTTGPDPRYGRGESPLLRTLLQEGLAVAGFEGEGLRCDADGAVLDRQDRPTPDLFSLGPPRMGTLFESVAIPEIRAQAAALAAHLREAIHPETARGG